MARPLQRFGFIQKETIWIVMSKEIEIRGTMTRFPQRTMDAKRRIVLNRQTEGVERRAPWIRCMSMHRQSRIMREGTGNHSHTGLH
jgi:hypothetical protein